MVPVLRGSFRVTSGFGPRVHPVTGLESVHNGVDIGAPTGTPVYAPRDGTVYVADGIGSAYNGREVRMVDADGYHWFFLHLSAVSVTKGQAVPGGTVLGQTGATGRVTGPHLHLEVHDPSGTPVDPLSLGPVVA